MSTGNRDLFGEALDLPLHQRAALAEVLVDSLPLEQKANIEQAWREEVHRRLQEYEQGRMKALDGEEVFEELLRDEE
jgi:putative addiction module component (TIGR02574 family)